jgi:hypothetical protein
LYLCAGTQATLRKELFDGNFAAQPVVAGDISDAEAALSEYSQDGEVAVLQIGVGRQRVRKRKLA